VDVLQCELPAFLVASESPEAASSGKPHCALQTGHKPWIEDFRKRPASKHACMPEKGSDVQQKQCATG